ncbi:MAG: CapA family protein [Clostridia bacterium]|nr:CapA family protein [Clostridia bacterium]
MRKPLTIGMLMLLLLGIMPLASAELQGYDKNRGYDYVTMGSYPYTKEGEAKPVLWRVLSVEDGKALLLTEYILDAKQVIFENDQKVIEKHAFRRISAYDESDLYAWLNTEGIDILLGDDPLRGAVLEEPGLGFLYPLRDEDYLNQSYGFENGRWGEALNAYPSHQAVCTPYAAAHNLYVDSRNKKSPYWCVAIKGATDYKFGLVGYNGHISWGAYTNIKVGGLRLAVRLDLSLIDIQSGTGTQSDPYVPRFAGAPALPEAALTETSAAATAAAPAAEPTAALTAAPTEAPTEAPTTEIPAEKSGVTLSLIGDCSIGDSYQSRQVANSYHNVVAQNGYGWPFSLVSDYLLNDDWTVANLEVVLTRRTKHSDKMYNMIADPDHVQILLEGGVEMVNTVNNHCMDFLDAGYQDTLSTLAQAGVAYFGTVYPNKPEGHDDLGVRDVGDIRFGFVGFSYPQDSDVKRIASRIKKLKEEEGCDVVIVSLHWGRETYMTPENWQISYAKQVIDAGADAIWGHHPHVLQPIQFYKGKPILYSTGNFTFGTMSKVDPSTGIFQLTYEKTEGKAELKELRVIPCETQGSPDYRPFELTDPAARKQVFSKLVLKREYKGTQNPPASFLESGIIQFENGQMLP